MIPYTVGIPVRNEANTLEHCVAAILCQQPTPLEVLICLNGSDIETQNVADKLSANPRVKVITSQPGKPKAWNAITQASKTDLIYFTDGDSLMQPDAAKSSLTALTNAPHASITGGDLMYLLPPNPPLISKLFKNRINRRVRPRNLSGANYMMRRDMFLQLGDQIGIKMLPEYIIHEDVLIGAFARVHKQHVANDSVVCIFPPTTLIDYLRSHIRYKRSMMLLESQFPQYIQNGLPKSQISVISQPRNIAFSAIRYGVDVVSSVYVSMTGKEQSQQWTELKSTKPRLSYAQKINVA